MSLERSGYHAAALRRIARTLGQKTPSASEQHPSRAFEPPGCFPLTAVDGGRYAPTAWIPCFPTPTRHRHAMIPAPSTMNPTAITCA
jgi:hypothetical protein